MQIIVQKKIAHHSERYERIKSKVSTGKWHLKRRKAISTKIWNYIYDELVEGFEKDFLPDGSRIESQNNKPWFEIVFHGTDHITVITMRKFSKAFKGFVFEGKDETNEHVVSQLNLALSHYELQLRKPTKPENKYAHVSSSEQHYFVDFVNE